MDQINGTKQFTKLNLQEAYNLIHIAEGEEWKTIFYTKIGLYEYFVMPMGLTNVPASFQALMNNMLRDYINKICEVYLNNILVYSKNPEEYNKHVCLILQKLKEYSLKVDLEKSKFDKEEVEFLGYIIGKDSIKIDLKKIQVILK